MPEFVAVAISDIDRYWLAGLLEGEGTFMAGPPSQPRSPVMAVVMTDRDVVERVGQMWDRAVAQVKPRKPHHKVAFATRVRGAAAASWMLGVKVMLGSRRQAQIQQALARGHARLRWRRPTGTCSVPSCKRPGAVRGLCKHHHKLSWKAKRAGRPSRYVAVDASEPIDEAPLIEPDRKHLAWIAWLGGLLEGEGTFTSSGAYPVISMQMCDRDVVERAASLLAIKTIYARKDERTRLRGWSPSFSIAIGGSRAAEWMRRLRDHMGRRRTSEIDRALAGYHPIRLTEAPEHCVVDDCDRPHRSRGLCHKHYMMWSRDRKAGKPQRIEPLR